MESNSTTFRLDEVAAFIKNIPSMCPVSWKNLSLVMGGWSDHMITYVIDFADLKITFINTAHNAKHAKRAAPPCLKKISRSTK